jgi:uncharacterized protein involved in exopolysaccharide biosynthesis
VTTAVVSAGKIEGPREATSLLAFFAVLLAHRRMIALCGLVGTLAFGVFALSEAARFESRASFIVKGSAPPVALPNTASSLGVLLTSHADFSQSVVFFSDFVNSNVLLRIVAAGSYPTSASRGVKRPLPELFGVKEKNRTLAINSAAEKLAHNVSASINTRSGVVSVSVATFDPLLAQELVTAIVNELEDWSKERSHIDAVKEREFVEGLANDAKGKLSEAEQAMNTFLVTNRIYNAPDLAIEHDRLQRQVNMRQEIFTQLEQSLEQAKIEEGRDRSPVNVVEVGDLPIEPQRVAAMRKTMIGLAAGLFVGMALAFVRQRAAEKRLIDT